MGLFQKIPNPFLLLDCELDSLIRNLRMRELPNELRNYCTSVHNQNHSKRQHHDQMPDGLEGARDTKRFRPLFSQVHSPDSLEKCSEFDNQGLPLTMPLIFESM
jgi:hypothetical protein